MRPVFFDVYGAIIPLLLIFAQLYGATGLCVINNQDMCSLTRAASLCFPVVPTPATNPIEPGQPSYPDRELLSAAPVFCATPPVVYGALNAFFQSDDFRFQKSQGSSRTDLNTGFNSRCVSPVLFSNPDFDQVSSAVHELLQVFLDFIPGFYRTNRIQVALRIIGQGFRVNRVRFSPLPRERR